MSQQDISMLSPRHVCYVAYPDVSLLQGRNHVLTLLPVENAKARYKPGELIDHPNLRGYEMRPVWYEWTHHVGPATMDKKNLDAVMRKVPTYGRTVHQLAQTIEKLSAYNGCTHLNAVTYKRDNRENSPIMLHVDLLCEFQLLGGELQRCSSTFRSLRLDDLRLLGSTEFKDALWLKNLNQLIHRSTDSAFLNVQAALKRFKVDEDEQQWRPRGYDVKQALTPMLVEPDESYDAEENLCYCWEPMRTALVEDQLTPATSLTDAAEWVVQVGCQGTHRYHFQCLLDLHKSNTARAEHEDFERPQSEAFLCWCRSPYARKQIDGIFERMIFGVEGKNYIFDPNFDEYSNWERSCGDLDLCGHHRKTVTVDQRLIREVFNMMVQGARKEPEEVTPLHMQITRCADFQLLERAVINATTELHGLKVRVPNLFEAVMSELFDEAIREFKKSGLIQTLDLRQDGLPWYRSRSFFATRAMRPFFMYHAEKLLHRTIMFLVARRCEDCDISGPFHNHGERVYMSTQCRTFNIDEEIEEVDLGPDFDPDSDSDSGSESESESDEESDVWADDGSEIDLLDSDWSSDSGESDCSESESESESGGVNIEGTASN